MRSVVPIWGNHRRRAQQRIAVDRKRAQTHTRVLTFIYGRYDNWYAQCIQVRSGCCVLLCARWFIFGGDENRTHTHTLATSPCGVHDGAVIPSCTIVHDAVSSWWLRALCYYAMLRAQSILLCDARLTASGCVFDVSLNCYTIGYRSGLDSWKIGVNVYIYNWS